MEKQETNKLVLAVAAIMMGFGGIAFVLWLSPLPILELFQGFLLTILPVLCILALTGIIGWGTLQLIWSQDLAGRVRDHIQNMQDSDGDPDSPEITAH